MIGVVFIGWTLYLFLSRTLWKLLLVGSLLFHLIVMRVDEEVFVLVGDLDDFVG